MGVLTENWIKRTCCAVWFPYPIKVTGVSYTLENFQADSRSVFPSPPEVTGGSYPVVKKALMNDFIEFPSPFEVTGVSNLVRLQPSEPVRVRFRTLARKLGVITIHWVALINYRKEFPYPREVIRGITKPSTSKEVTK